SDVHRHRAGLDRRAAGVSRHAAAGIEERRRYLDEQRIDVSQGRATRHLRSGRWPTVPTNASHLDLDIRPPAGPALAAAGGYQPVQRGDGPAALRARADTPTKWDGLSSRARQGCGLHARVGGEALRVDRRSALPPVSD